MKQNKFIDYIIITAGSVIYALSVVVFTSPNNIAPGGLTGVGILLNYLFSIPIGTFILIMNVPIFILGYRFLGKRFVRKSLLGTILASVFNRFSIPVYHTVQGGYDARWHIRRYSQRRGARAYIFARRLNGRC